MRFSVVICTLNRSTSLARTLDIARRMRLDASWEVVVVDNGSTDGQTEAVVSKLAATYPVPLQCVREERVGKTAALNTGIAAARGDIIAFTDDDTAPEPNWLAELDATFRSKECEWAFGRIDPDWQTNPPSWYSPAVNGVLGLLDYGDLPFAVTSPSFPFFGANCAATREALARLGGYREEFAYIGDVGGGEDMDIFRRAFVAGMRIQYVPGATVKHLITRDRTRKGFHRRRTFKGSIQNYRLVTENSEPAVRLLGLPRYLFRLAWDDACGYLRSICRGDARAAFPHELRLVRFVGLMQYALKRHASEHVR